MSAACDLRNVPVPVSLLRARRRLVLWVLMLLASACSFDDSGGGCGGSLINNYRFDRWCGDQLCNWVTLTGASSIRRVPTWHDNDFGVELLATPTVLTQKRYIDDVECFELEMVADIDPSANVELGLDYNFDGDAADPEEEAQVAPDVAVDASVALPTAKWKKLTFLFATPVNYYGVRFVIRKSGTGHAVLAEVRASASDKCTAPRPELDDLPLGVRCAKPSACTTAVCATTTPRQALIDFCELATPEQDCEAQWSQGPFGDGVDTCGECADDADCPGAICGVVDGPRGAFRRCSLLAELGERCVEDLHCVSGHCNTLLGYTQSWLFGDTGTCGSCVSDGDCPNGQVCGLDTSLPARACVPAGTKPLSSVCEIDAECRSGICCEGRCSDCCPTNNDTCADACETQSYERDGQGFITPHLCTTWPAQPTDSECLDDRDCASGTCVGTMDVCSDEQRCVGSACQRYAGHTCDAMITIAGRCQ